MSGVPQVGPVGPHDLAACGLAELFVLNWVIDFSLRHRVLVMLALNDALERLERDEPKKAALVKLRFFAGLPLSA